MSPELVKKFFSDLYVRCCMVDKRADSVEDFMYLSFQEGVVRAQQFVIDNFNVKKK